MDRTLGWVLLALGGVLLVIVVVAPMAMMGGTMGGPMMAFPWGMLVMLLIPLGLIVLIGLLGVRLLGQRSPAASPPRESPLDILDRRYANGEVTREEYERVRADLQRR